MGDSRVLGKLADRALLVGLRSALGKARMADAEVVRFIAEVDRRKLYREQGCSSMFRYCVERLGMSEGAAYRRIKVARLVRRLPVVLEHLSDGRVHLAAVDALAAHLDRQNVVLVLGRARRKSLREVQQLVVELAQQPDVRTTIRRVPVAQSTQTEAALQTELLSSKRFEPAKSATIRPLAPARYHVSFTASEELKQHIERAKELAGHGANVEALIEDAMALLVAKLEQDRLGVAGRKAPKVANPRGRYIAKAIKREVFERDGGRCTHIGSGGHRCSERTGLQLDHVVPHALGGASTAANLRLRCGPHNQLHAEVCFGPLFVESKRERPGSP